MEYESIKQLINDMGDSKLSSLQIDFPDGTKISMVKESEKVSCTNTAVSKTENNIDNNSESNSEIDLNKSNCEISDEVSDNYRYIKSPMVGTFYTSQIHY